MFIGIVAFLHFKKIAKSGLIGSLVLLRTNSSCLAQYYKLDSSGFEPEAPAYLDRTLNSDNQKIVLRARAVLYRTEL